MKNKLFLRALTIFCTQSKSRTKYRNSVTLLDISFIGSSYREGFVPGGFIPEDFVPLKNTEYRTQSGHCLFCVPRGALGCNVVVLIRLRRPIMVCSNDFYMLRPIDCS